MTDPELRGGMAIMLKSGSAFLTSSPNLSAQMILERILLSVEHGNTPESVPSYASYALIQCSILKKMDVGNQFGELALKLCEKPGAKRYRCRTKMIVFGFVYHWTHYVGDCIEWRRD